MKMIKKILGVVTVFALALSMCMVTNAATTEVPVSVSGFDGHTIKAYKILSGEIPETTSTDVNLVNIDWASDAAGVALVDELKKEENSPVVVAEAAGVAGKKLHEYFKDLTKDAAGHYDANAFAKVLDQNADTVKFVEGFTKVAQALATQKNADGQPVNKLGEGTNLMNAGVKLSSGYYLIVDETSLAPGDAHNASILQVADAGITIENKTTKPTLDKTVQENTLKGASGEEGYVEVADYNIGDEVPFKVTATIPNINKFEKYFVEITDTLSAGLTRPTNLTDVEIKAYIYESETDTTPRTKDDIEAGTGVSFTADNSAEIKYTNSDVRAWLEDTEKTNENTKVVIEMKYKAKLNENANLGKAGNENTAVLKYSSHPTYLDQTNSTPPDKVIVYSMAIQVKKVDSENNDLVLQGAEFRLQRTNNGNTEYAQITNNKITGWIAEIDQASKITTDDNGIVDIQGLDSGEYKLEETKAPAGYNNPNGATFTVLIDPDYQYTYVDATDSTTKIVEYAKDDESKYTKLDVTTTNPGATAGTKTSVSADNAAGIMEGTVTIANVKGSNLPETGGMGTTLFYIIGGLLVVGAGVVLVTKKRLENK